MIEGVVQFTEEEKKAIIEKRKERNGAYAKNLQWKRKAEKAVQKVRLMAVTRFERLLEQTLLTSGYTDDEANQVIRYKHFKQPIVEQEEEEEELAFKYTLWKSA